MHISNRLVQAVICCVLPFSAMTAIAASYPNQPISIIVPYAAGGGTDAVGRILASEMEKTLGQPVNVVNRTGGNGVAGSTALANSDPDGYMLGVMTVESTQHHNMGLTPYALLDAFEPLALVNADPVSVFVAAESPYKDVRDLITASKDKQMVASGAATGGIYHLALAGMLLSLDADASSIRWVPSNGAMPALQDLVAGGIQVAVATLPEARSLIEAGKVRAIVTMADERSPQHPDVPTLKESSGSSWTTLNWRGMVAPKGLAPEVKQKLVDSISAAVQSAAYQDFLSKRGFGGAYAPPEEFEALAKKSEKDLAQVSKSAGITK